MSVNIDIKAGMHLLMLPTINRLLKEAIDSKALRGLADWESVLVMVIMSTADLEGIFHVYFAPVNTRNVIYKIPTEELRNLKVEKPELHDFMNRVHLEEWNGALPYFRVNSNQSTELIIMGVINDLGRDIDHTAFWAARSAVYSEPNQVHDTLGSGRIYYVDMLHATAYSATFDSVVQDIAAKDRKLRPLVLPGFDKPFKPKVSQNFSDPNRLIGSDVSSIEESVKSTDTSYKELSPNLQFGKDKEDVEFFIDALTGIAMVLNEEPSSILKERMGVLGVFVKDFVDLSNKVKDSDRLVKLIGFDVTEDKESPTSDEIGAWFVTISRNNEQYRMLRVTLETIGDNDSKVIDIQFYNDKGFAMPIKFVNDEDGIEVFMDA